MQFNPGVPLNTKLDIMQSRIRQTERAIVIIKEKRAAMWEQLEQLENDLQRYKDEFKKMLAERAEQ
jgi:predicted  nucleic acid-binding Zn-ribbon protein